MLLPRASALQRRAADNGRNTYVFIALGAVAVSVILFIVLVGAIRSRRKRSEEPPRWLPKLLHQRWRNWKPIAYAPVSTPLENQRRGAQSDVSTRATSIRENDDLDRRTSVRSIMTLPPYHHTPLPSERLIAREGERAGVDMVVEYPETEQAMEERREEEMATLFAIRQARRREAEEREQRRVQRREARQAGDWARLEELERDSRARARERSDRESTIMGQIQAIESGETVEQDSGYLIAELNSLRDRNSRSRRVSSVSYADLGTARHDGSRIRAGSFESDNHPLLDSAASVGQRSRATSRASSAGRGPSISEQGGLFHGSRPNTAHTRHASEGAASYLEDEDDEEHTANRPNLLTPQSSEELPPNPPSYDDDLSVHGGEAPPYESPVDRRGPAFPSTTPNASPPSSTPPPSQHDPQTTTTNPPPTSSASEPYPHPHRTDTQNTQASSIREPDPVLEDEVRVAQSYLMRDESWSSSPTGQNNDNTPAATSSGGSNSGRSEGRGGGGNASSPGSVRSPPLTLQTKPRLPPQIEVSSATPVSSVPNSPVEGRR